MLSWKGDLLGIVQGIEISPYEQVVHAHVIYVQSESIQENEAYKIIWDLVIKTDHLISTRRPDVMIVKK